MKEERINALIASHRLATLRELLVAVPLMVLLPCLRPLTIVLMPLGFLLYFTSSGRWTIAKILAMADVFVSERSTGLRSMVASRLTNWSGGRIRDLLKDTRGFMLFLRDFDPAESGLNYYKWIRGAVKTYSHRDSYLFDSLEKFALPVLAVAQPVGGAVTNESFVHFREGRNWLANVEEFADAARIILVVVPSSLWALLSAKDVLSAERIVEEFSGSEWEEKSKGLAAELLVILRNPRLREKTLLVNVLLDGNPYLTESWFSLRTFESLEGTKIRDFLEGKTSDWG